MSTKKKTPEKKTADAGRNVYKDLVSVEGRPLTLDVTVTNKGGRTAHFTFVWDAARTTTFHLSYDLFEGEGPKEVAHAMTGALVLDPKFAEVVGGYSHIVGVSLNWEALYPARVEIAKMIQAGIEALPLVV